MVCQFDSNQYSRQPVAFGLPLNVGLLRVLCSPSNRRSLNPCESFDLTQISSTERSKSSIIASESSRSDQVHMNSCRPYRGPEAARLPLVSEVHGVMANFCCHPEARSPRRQPLLPF